MTSAVPTPDQLRDLRDLRVRTENLASSTLTLIEQIRSLDIDLPPQVRTQMTLVICDGGQADLALADAFPQDTLPQHVLEGRQELRRGLIGATFANTASPTEAARLLTAPPRGCRSIELGDLALARIVEDPASADRLADLLDERTGVSSRDDEAVIA